MAAPGGQGNRLPTVAHKRKGNYRPSRHEGVEPKIQKPKMPTGLSKRAIGLWKSLTELLREHSLISKLDRVALQLLCESFEIYAKAMDDIEINGIILIEDGPKESTRTKKNPAVDIRDSAWAQIHKMCREFGLTPAARCGLKPSNEANPSDALEKILGIKVN